MVLRVVSWPLGYILAAKGEAKLVFWTELLANALQVVLIWFGVGFFALPGTGMGFFGLYIFYSVGIYFVVRRLSGFRWSPANRHLGGLLGVLVGIVFAAWYLFSHLVAGALGAVVTMLVGLYSLRTLCTLVPLDKLPKVLVKFLRFIRLVR
jgi:PST family polysaccharide transporter